MDFQEFKAKTVEEAVTAATVAMGITSDELDYEVIEKGSTGFLGLGAKPAIIKARKKEKEVVKQAASADTTGLVEKTKEYLDSLFKAMDIESEEVLKSS